MTSAYPAFHLQEDPLRIFESRAARTAYLASERVCEKPHACLSCRETIARFEVAAVVTVGGKRDKFTGYFHADRCVPLGFHVPKIDPLRAWRGAKRAMLSARRPEDVPAWVASMLIPF